MFREIVRKKRRISNDECMDILRNEKRGVLSVIGDEGYPYGMPLNHFYNDEDGRIYFHSGKTGHKIDAMKADEKASFCIYDSGFRRDGEWALNIKSVIVFGRIEFVEDYDKAMDISRRRSRKFTDNEEYIENEVSKYGRNTLVFALVPEHITGKIVNEA